MNDSMIQMARMRRDEMIREAEHDKLATRVSRMTRRAARTARAAARPVLRLADAKIRPTATGR
jgi:hypothetical protein